MLALVAPFPMAALLGRACMPGLGDRIAHGLTVATPLASSERSSRDDGANGRPGLGLTDEPVGGPGVAPLANGAPDASASRATSAGASPRKAAAPKTLHLPAAQVARALSGGLDGVRGRTARDAQGHPVGVRLTGVSRLGVGLQDGDVVTSIDGTKTPDDDTATAVALGAVGRGAHTVRATVLRGSDPIDVVVELPADDAATPH